MIDDVMIRSIVLVRLSALGDVLMFVPLVRTLQYYFPEASLTWIISEPAYSLVSEMKDIEFIVLEKPKNIIDYGRFYRKMRHRQFDVLIAAQASFRANLLYPCLKAKRKIGYDAHRAKDGHGWFVRERILPGRDHTLEGFLKFSHVLGISTPKIMWDLPISDCARAWHQEHFSNQSYWILNPAASKPERSWSVARYIEVIRDVCHRYQLPVVLTGGPSQHDREIGEAIAAAVPVQNWIGRTHPQQLLACMEKAVFVLCPDTGPSHMAAALGTPVVALHAVTHAGVSGPYPFLSYAVNQYPQAVEQVLGQTLETCPWGTHVHGDRAMALITVAEVLKKIDQCIQIRYDRDSVTEVGD